MEAKDRTPADWVAYLARVHEGLQSGLEDLNRYYEGKQELSYLNPELLEELGDQIRQVVINWPSLVVDSLEERLDVEGFRYADDEAAADDLWSIWQANGMDEKSQQGHIDALVMRRSFVVVGTNEKNADVPLLTVESPLQMQVDRDPRTRQVRAALKRWHEQDPITDAVTDRYAALYLPDETVYYRQTSVTSWAETDRDQHKLGEVPVVPLINRGRIMKPNGVSEIARVLPLSDAANKIATDMMVSAEFHAVPRRVAFGVDEEDFVDQNGQQVSKWSRIAGRIWAMTKKRGGEDGADVVQFPEAQLSNFHSTIELLARLTGGLSGLPPNFLGLDANNPPSADAIRSAETRLVKRAERRQRSFGGSYEQMNRLILRFRDGDWDPRALNLETLWRDASTPTFAQKADAVVKLVQAHILPVEQAREDLGYTAVQRERMRRMDNDAVGRVLGGELDALYGPKPLAEAIPADVPPGA
ncbi:phage portal protein [Streptomyces sp. NBC_00847]|uniref:phage portal protein n=1 Tax=Streptomyces sp. NBC_00847 TaxID=2975850 RepID=UPI00225DF8AB|nr:phage portal protein [Streptomyces sp. NBC_00847]MCX4886050.1 phage portal protein [Streptomyces sp. NBC_00847]